MATLFGIARPYALAAFEFARDHQQLAQWKTFLNAAAIAVRDKKLQPLLNDPNISANKMVDLLHEVLAVTLDPARSNFLRLLGQNKRLIALPEISDLFAAYLAYLEKISNVRIVTAINIDDAFKQKLSQALSKRLQHNVTMQEEVDPAILGGAIIHIGDRVIDGSIRGKLTRLLENLTG